MADKKNIKKIHFLILFANAIFMLPFISCKKNKNDASQELSEVSKDDEETELVSEVDFYDPSGDDASWVDNLLAQLEEERIAEELAAMEVSYLDYQLDQSPAPEIVENVSSVDVSSAVESSEVEEEMHPVEKFFAESGEGLTLRGKNNDFCFHSTLQLRAKQLYHPGAPVHLLSAVFLNHLGKTLLMIKMFYIK